MHQLDALTRFEMSSGRSLTVEVVDLDKLQVQYGRLPRRTLAADGRDAFVSGDRRVRLVFELAAYGRIRRVALSLLADRV